MAVEEVLLACLADLATANDVDALVEADAALSGQAEHGIGIHEERCRASGQAPRLVDVPEDELAA